MVLLFSSTTHTYTHTHKNTWSTTGHVQHTYLTNGWADLALQLILLYMYLQSMCICMYEMSDLVTKLQRNSIKPGNIIHVRVTENRSFDSYQFRLCDEELSSMQSQQCNVISITHRCHKTCAPITPDTTIPQLTSTTIQIYMGKSTLHLCTCIHVHIPIRGRLG